MHQKASIQQVQNMDVFLNCKQLRAIRCTLKQAQALALATGTFDLLQDLNLTIVRGEQDEGFTDLHLPVRCLTIELSASTQCLSPILVSNLQYVKIEGFGGACITHADVENISSSTRLESMILRHCVESVPDPLSIIATASRLIKLDISYNLRNAAFCDKSLSILKSCLTLRDLDVSFTKISAAGLVSLRGMTTLTRLAANSCDIEDAFVQQFSEAFPRLETLELSSSW